MPRHDASANQILPGGQGLDQRGLRDVRGPRPREEGVLLALPGAAVAVVHAGTGEEDRVARHRVPQRQVPSDADPVSRGIARLDDVDPVHAIADELGGECPPGGVLRRLTHQGSAARTEGVVQARQAPDLMDAPGELGRCRLASPARWLQGQVPVTGQGEPRPEPVDVVVVVRHFHPLVLLDVGVAGGECLHHLLLVDERLVAGRSLESEVVDVGHRRRQRLAPRRERDLTHRAVAGDQVRPQARHVGAGRQGDGRPRTRGRTQPDEPVTTGDAARPRCVGTTDPVGDRVRARASPSRQRLVAQLHPDSRGTRSVPRSRGTRRPRSTGPPASSGGSLGSPPRWRSPGSWPAKSPSSWR